MSNNTNTPPHKAIYLVEKFIDTTTLKINVYDISILTRIAKLIDWNFKENQEHILYGFQDEIAAKCRIGRPYLNSKMQEYVDQKWLDQFTFYRGRSNKYGFGEVIDPSRCQRHGMYSRKEKNTLQVVMNDMQVVGGDLHVVTDDTYK